LLQAKILEIQHPVGAHESDFH